VVLQAVLLGVPAPEGTQEGVSVCGGVGESVDVDEGTCARGEGLSAGGQAVGKTNRNDFL
jgi:hypothetical protein